jgi:hypothetical protein
MTKKKLKLTRLTVAHLQRVRGGDDPICFCPIIPTLPDEAFYHNGAPTISCKSCHKPC